MTNLHAQNEARLKDHKGAFASRPCRVSEMATGYGIEMQPEMEERFQIYARLLTEWNKRINLTAITESDEINIKHFLDSLLPLNAIDIPRGAKVLDVGTGAGFPGVPMKIVREDLRLTLLDSLNKRIIFLQELSHQLGQGDNTCIHGRAEVLAKENNMREQFDFVTARAVASLSGLCEYCLPFVKVGGIFIALKGYCVEEELEAACNAIKLLGAEVMDVKKYKLPLDNSRALVLIKKISHTSPKYPRTGVKISKTPL